MLVSNYKKKQSKKDNMKGYYSTTMFYNNLAFLTKLNKNYKAKKKTLLVVQLQKVH